MSTRTVHFVSSSSDPDNDDNLDIVMAKRGCCFWIPFMSTPPPPPLSSNPSSGPSTGGVESTWWERIQVADRLPEGPWWMRGWHRFREWSELVAGPRWKNFIRRFSKSRMTMRKGGSQFRYDPLSYAMNFDEGAEQNGDSLARDFSSRYASIPASCKSSMDLGHSGPLSHEIVSWEKTIVLRDHTIVTLQDRPVPVHCNGGQTIAREPLFARTRNV